VGAPDLGRALRDLRPPVDMIEPERVLVREIEPAPERTSPAGNDQCVVLGDAPHHRLGPSGRPTRVLARGGAEVVPGQRVDVEDAEIGHGLVVRKRPVQPAEYVEEAVVIGARTVPEGSGDGAALLDLGPIGQARLGGARADPGDREQEREQNDENDSMLYPVRHPGDLLGGFEMVFAEHIERPRNVRGPARRRGRSAQTVLGSQDRAWLEPCLSSLGRILGGAASSPERMWHPLWRGCRAACGPLLRAAFSYTDIRSGSCNRTW